MSLGLGRTVSRSSTVCPTNNPIPYVCRLTRLGFPVSIYGGKKELLISTRTVMGGKNSFLGIAYVVVGGLCILLGAIFTATHLIKPRSVLSTHSPSTSIRYSRNRMTVLI